MKQTLSTVIPRMECDLNVDFQAIRQEYRDHKEKCDKIRKEVEQWGSKRQRNNAFWKQFQS